MGKKINFINPNFSIEWEQAEKIPEFKDLGKTDWSSFAGSGYKVKFSEIKDHVKNLELTEVSHIKKQRVQSAIKKGQLEIPIFVKLSDDKYEIISGKTRIHELNKLGINDIPVWIVDISNMMFLIQPV